MSNPAKHKTVLRKALEFGYEVLQAAAGE